MQKKYSDADQATGYIYNNEPADWPTREKIKTRGNVCVCPNCGSTAVQKHQTVCADRTCPVCGTVMTSGWKK